MRHADGGGHPPQSVEVVQLPGRLVRDHSVQSSAGCLQMCVMLDLEAREREYTSFESSENARVGASGQGGSIHT